MTDIPYDERGYRPCVGIFLLNEANLLFAGRRIDNRAEAWQMPQGGIDHGESVIEACLREMEEEIGTNKAELLREHEEWLHYDIPQPLSDRLWHGKYRGQKQRWVALRFTGTDATSISTPPSPSSVNGGGSSRAHLSSSQSRSSGTSTARSWTPSPA